MFVDIDFFQISVTFDLFNIEIEQKLKENEI